MTILRTTLILVTTGLLCSACEQAPEPPPDAPDPKVMMAAAEALDNAFVEAFNRGDAAELADLYWNSPEVVFFPPNTLEQRGIDAIRSGVTQLLDTMKGATLEMTESHQMPVGDVVIGWGLYKLTTPSPDGNATEVVGRFTDVKALRNGRWVYLIDHASVPMTEPAPASSTM